MKQKRQDIIAAGCLGDAFGYVIEFDRWTDIKRANGKHGLLTLKDTIASDDTQMTLFAMEGLINAFGPTPKPTVGRIVNEARKSFKLWLDTQTKRRAIIGLAGQKIMQAQRAPGGTCLSALKSDKVGTASNPINDSKGCGAVMRAAPYALLHGLYTHDEIWTMAAESGAITHGHVDGWAPGAALAYALSLMLNEGLSLIRAFAYAAMSVSKCAPETMGIIYKALSLPAGLTPDQINAELGEGWTGEEALAIALYAANTTNCVWRAIQVAANHSGDSDSTASIAAQISAAVHGMSAYEVKQFKRIDLAALTVKMCNEFERVTAV